MRGRNERGDRGDLARGSERRADTDPPVAAERGGEAVSASYSLPPDLAGQSLTTAGIVLPLEAALRAIANAVEQGVRLESWEGWVKLHDGSRVRSLEHGGTFALPHDPARASQAAVDGMKHAQARFDRDPEYPDSRLYFGLTFAKA
jgi:hypothetical protein